MLSMGQGASDVSKSDMVKLDPERMAANKRKLRSGDTDLQASLTELLKMADKLLKYKPVSVMDKKDFPPSGNKHDYMSLAPYWWPDPSKADGMPYIRKDGEINPEVKRYTDKENLPKLCENIYLLSIAYYYSGNEDYARHASTLIRTWFIDSATKMNPHLNYGQAVKGVTQGRAEGLIDTRHFIYVVDAIGLMSSSKAWSATDQKSMQAWFAAFLDWMQTSPIGIDEMKAANNHGVWYEAQRLSYAIFIGDRKQADAIMQKVMERLDKEMDDKGAFPLELTRTITLHYSVFILNAYLVIAELSVKTGTDLWTAKTSSGKSLRKGMDFILPYLSGKKSWEWKQIRPLNMQNAFPLLLRGAQHYDCIECYAIMQADGGAALEKSIIRLL